MLAPTASSGRGPDAAAGCALSAERWLTLNVLGVVDDENDTASTLESPGPFERGFAPVSNIRETTPSLQIGLGDPVGPSILLVAESFETKNLTKTSVEPMT